MNNTEHKETNTQQKTLKQQKHEDPNTINEIITSKNKEKNNTRMTTGI